MATHSSVLAWRIPGTEEPNELLSMGLHRVGHDWSDLAAAAATLKSTVAGIEDLASSEQARRVTDWRKERRWEMVAGSDSLLELDVHLHLWKFLSWRFLCRGLTVSLFSPLPQGRGGNFRLLRLIYSGPKEEKWWQVCDPASNC